MSSALRDHETTIEYGRALPATAEDLPLADAAAYWTAFAKHSDPDSAGGQPWPRLQPVRGCGPGIQKTVGVKVVPNFHEESLDLVEQIAIGEKGKQIPNQYQ